ncbi:hypothetical protein CERZMDRAFT_102979 [Cercospora zeae-maydis SCOH1-5]|uniref:Aminoglycoside phosphotransferase domain-containing protein n=1 Tax=Cercospora zeae-maydis SCOH1-5 TaxID=717836 RepID=A0A6A6F0P4_9PEZI|nr:hypothetical protein CERZMDRAFT_102979 [Cercospora zeae-maydis SCOH1-5]
MFSDHGLSRPGQGMRMTAHPQTKVRLAAQHFAVMAAAQPRQEHDIFDCTWGRWLYNEKKRLSERYLPFNVPALLEDAAKSVDQQKTDIKSLRKLAEGGFNRVFEVTMRNGFQVIARLLYPSNQPKMPGTASEVWQLWNCNSVGSEYIVMQKVPGRCLGDIWYELSDKERVRLLGDVVNQEAKLFKIAFPAHGSIYSTVDLPKYIARTGMETEAGKFCVGPDVSLRYWFGTRSQLDTRRGRGERLTALAHYKSPPSQLIEYSPLPSPQYMTIFSREPSTRQRNSTMLFWASR